jgi:L-aminoadipate-semialdehyde dehydrogenase
MGNVIPAGKGMNDVQLLIVDRENQNRVCDVGEIGEIGEIYVKAAGLADTSEAASSPRPSSLKAGS